MCKTKDELNQLSGVVIDAAIKVHKALGPGLLESAYATCLFHELKKRGLNICSEAGLPVEYEDVKLDVGYRVDMLVDGEVILEVKAVDALNSIHEAQLLSYLKLGKKRLGLLLNFNVRRMKDGIKRMVNKL